MKRIDDVMIAEALEAIRATGQLTPDRVVAAAQDPAHPLHGHFEWDDAKAAHEHRLDTARGLIRIVTSTVTLIEGRRIEVPRYVRDPDAEPTHQGYVVTREMPLSSAQRAILSEITRARGALERALGIAVVSEHRQSIEQVRAALELCESIVANPPSAAETKPRRRRRDDEQPHALSA